MHRANQVYSEIQWGKKEKEEEEEAEEEEEYEIKDLALKSLFGEVKWPIPWPWRRIAWLQQTSHHCGPWATSSLRPWLGTVPLPWARPQFPEYTSRKREREGGVFLKTVW